MGGGDEDNRSEQAGDEEAVGGRRFPVAKLHYLDGVAGTEVHLGQRGAPGIARCIGCAIIAAVVAAVLGATRRARQQIGPAQ